MTLVGCVVGPHGGSYGFLLIFSYYQLVPGKNSPLIIKNKNENSGPSMVTRNSKENYKQNNLESTARNKISTFGVGGYSRNYFVIFFWTFLGTHGETPFMTHRQIATAEFPSSRPILLPS